MSKHTPAPWKWGEDKWNDGYSGLFGPDEQDVCVPLCRNDGDDGAAWFDPKDDPSRAEEIAANFLLMSEAPNLLDACQQALAAIDADYSGQFSEVEQLLIDAISNAGGEV